MWQLILIIVTILLGAQLWRMGGDGNKAMRSLWFPILIALAKFALVFPSWLALLYAPALMILIALFSYGVSAPLHILWVFIFGGKGSDGNYIPVEIATRATCGFLWSLAAIPFALISGNWIYQVLYTVFLTIANGLIGPFVKNVEISERAVGASVATAILV
jgi:hypothetical protein